MDPLRLKLWSLLNLEAVKLWLWLAWACLRGNLQEPQEPFHVTQLASITQNHRLPYSFTRPQGFSSVLPADNCFCLELQPLAAVL